MTETIVAITIVLFAALLIYAATRPDMFRVWRTTSIKASPDRIFSLINDFHNWDAWSPYEKLDPAMKRNLSGQPRGKGAVYEWESDSCKAGVGRMEIIESSPSSKIAIELDMAKPLKIRSIVEFTLESKDNTTQVVWDIHGINSYVGKIRGIFCNQDSMIGKDFEDGLINLKTIAER
ncbi:MAG: SRPBCC family protein [Methylobacter sp.]